jgi:hypothetical protein
MSNEKCPKCQGAGWVWGRELDHPSEETSQDTMTKYTCDECNGESRKEPQENILDSILKDTPFKLREQERKETKNYWHLTICNADRTKPIGEAEGCVCHLILTSRDRKVFEETANCDKCKYYLEDSGECDYGFDTPDHGFIKFLVPKRDKDLFPNHYCKKFGRKP